MADVCYLHRFHVLRQRWQMYTLLSRGLAGLTMAVVFTTLVYMMHGAWWWAIPITIICLAALLLPQYSWKVTEADVIRYFNITYPEMEESSGLLLKPYEQLTFLEQLQAQKIAQALDAIPTPQPLKKQLRICALAFILVMTVSAAIGWWVHAETKRAVEENETPQKTAAVKENVLPEINGVNISIQPPAYTHKTKRQQQQFNLEAEEGAQLLWDIRTNKPVTVLQLLLNDTAWIALQPANTAHTQWTGRAAATRAGFYQVQVEGKLSDLYKIAIIKDQPPVINIPTPKAYTIIDYGMPTRIALKVSVTDDYGISNAHIQATVASGSGEAVRFKEQPISFGESFSGAGTQYTLEKTIDLAALGMHPGSELYFYIQAQDNHRQAARSGMYMVVLPDTAQLMNIEGMANSMNLKPEYFRSQRQIIIETEQLIRDKDTLAEKTFQRRSNDLGIDQRLLRLRYGKFLGEETESNIGDDRLEEEHDHDHAAANDAKDFNNAEKIMDQFSHKHDIAEDATFFDPATKSQLKATLTEMWNAERELRTYKPQAALPYEYKALRLLKDLQQKSRAYVAKTSVRTAPLKPEKRLTGELDKIIFPLRQQQAAPTVTDKMAYALAILETLKSNGHLPDAVSLQVLQQAARQLANETATAPARYLPALQAMRQILAALEQQQNVPPAAVAIAEQALYNLLPPPVRLPQAGNATANISLSQQYFMNLQEK